MTGILSMCFISSMSSARAIEVLRSLDDSARISPNAQVLRCMIEKVGECCTDLIVVGSLFSINAKSRQTLHGIATSGKLIRPHWRSTTGGVARLAIFKAQYTIYRFISGTWWNGKIRHVCLDTFLCLQFPIGFCDHALTRS